MDRTGDQKAAHLVTAEIVDRGVPVVVETFARIGMLVQRRAVETVKPVCVGRKMRGHPIDDHPDARLMGTIDKAREAIRWTETGGRREQAQRLITPRAAERMFRNWHELDMSETE